MKAENSSKLTPQFPFRKSALKKPSQYNCHNNRGIPLFETFYFPHFFTLSLCVLAPANNSVPWNFPAMSVTFYINNSFPLQSFLEVLPNMNLTWLRQPLTHTDTLTPFCDMQRYVLSHPYIEKCSPHQRGVCLVNNYTSYQ